MNPLLRLFSSFPGGWPGLALLLLRATVGLTAAVQASLYLSGSLHSTLGTLLAFLLLAISAVCLLIGFATPVMSVLAALVYVGTAFFWLRAPAGNLFDNKLVLIEMISMTLAVALLGPGAFSLDARLFGRREIIIPPLPRSPKP